MPLSSLSSILVNLSVVLQLSPPVVTGCPLIVIVDVIGFPFSWFIFLVFTVLYGLSHSFYFPFLQFNHLSVFLCILS